MLIAVEGCAHGELQKIYECIEHLEQKNNTKVDLLICCGDFQSVRNTNDLCCMAVPAKYHDICTFYKYYNGEKVAPVLTLFIGGNHEASNYLQELPYGGWVAPNIYYLGYAGVVSIGGVRIAGLSGIYKGHDYLKGHFEITPYTDNTKRSVYHIRNLEVFRLKQLSGELGAFLSHDWPRGAASHGDVDRLLRTKPFFTEEVEQGRLGSAPGEELLQALRPQHWFAGHLHCHYPALIPHNGADTHTRFLALDKCLPHRKFLQVVDIPHDESLSLELQYDLEWLTILHITNHLLNVRPTTCYMPGENGNMRYNFTPTNEEKKNVMKMMNEQLSIPQNFSATADAYDPSSQSGHKRQPAPVENPQTALLCNLLQLDDPVSLILLQAGNVLPPASPVSLNKSIFTPESKSQRTFSDLSETSISSPMTPLCLPTPTRISLPEPTVVRDRSPISPDRKVEIHSIVIDSKPDMELATPVLCSTPMSKKPFKRRNESFYKNEDE